MATTMMMMRKKRKIEQPFDNHEIRNVRSGCIGSLAPSLCTSDKVVTNDSAISMAKTSPSWEILSIVADHLDVQTLAKSSCVSKTWSSCFSADHHWKQHCETNYPSISHLKTTTPQVSYHRLYSLARGAAIRRLQKPVRPRLALQNLLFTVQLKIPSTDSALFVIVPGEDLVTGPHGMFQFDIDLKGLECFRPSDVPKHNNMMVMSWNVVMKNMESMFSMMDCEGELLQSDVGSWGGGWFFSKELPAPAFNSKDIGSGMMADLRLRVSSVVEKDVGKKRVEKVHLGLMTTTGCSYVSMDDGLRYLEYFLLV